jgi:hypothetical protein
MEAKVNNALVVGVIEAKRAFGLLVQIRRVTDLEGLFERGVLAANLVSFFSFFYFLFLFCFVCYVFFFFFFLDGREGE